MNTPCQISAIGTMCERCGRLVQAHSICPESGTPATPPTAEALAIAAAREHAAGLMGALLGGKWPTGDPVNAVESVRVARWTGSDTSGPPDEVISLRVVNGVLEEGTQHHQVAGDDNVTTTETEG